MAESVMSEGKPVVVSKCLNSNSSCSKSSDTIWLMPPLSVHTKMRCLLSSVTNIVALLLRLVLRCALRVCNLKVICLTSFFDTSATINPVVDGASKIPFSVISINVRYSHCPS